MTQANTDKYRAFKVELKPVLEQIEKIERTMGVCRFIFNLFISVNQERRNEAISQAQAGEKPGATFMSGYEFSKWLNNEWREANPDKGWVCEVSSKAVKHSIMDADAAYRKFMSGKAGFPKYKRRYGKPVGVYLPRNGKDLAVERHRAKIPLDRNKKNIKKEVNAAAKRNWSNVARQRKKLQKAHRRLTCVRRDYLNKIAAELVSVRPEFITIEDLNVKGMMKNRHLARSIAECEFFYFRMILTRKCHERGIELRLAGRWYPSSKTCSVCGNVKHDLKLSDRVYDCPVCGAVIDRDYNAAVNLKNCDKFAVA